MAEKLIQVNKKDEVIGEVDRYIAHSGEGVLHRGFMIVVKNYNNEIYIAQRSAKRPDLENFPAPFPLQWDASIAGHPRAGRSYEARVIKELEEELGLHAKKRDLQWLGKFYYIAPDPACTPIDKIRVIETEICGTYLLYTEQEPKPNPVEIQRGMWVPTSMLQTLVEQFAKDNVVIQRNGTINVSNFDRNKRAFTPWFVKAQKLYPQIYSRP